MAKKPKLNLSIGDPNKDYNFLVSIPEELQESYYLALGKFIYAFARAEESLNAEIINFVKERIAAAKNPKDYVVLDAVLGSTTFALAKDNIKRLLRVTNVSKEKIKEIERIFHHWDNIALIRNKLVHTGATPDMTNKEGWYRTSNNIGVREMDKMESVYFKPQTLLNMYEDLIKIPMLVSFVVNYELLREWKKSRSQEIEREYYGPWSYNPKDIKQLRFSGPRHQSPKVVKPKQPKPKKRLKN